jgi:hypothetical protein
MSASADTVLQSTNFNSPGFTLGALSADPTGVVAGQGGWYTYTAGLGGSANWTISNDPAAGGTRGQVLATTAGTTATGNNSTRFAWTDDIANASRPASETFITTTYDFYVGGSATSTNRYGAYMYDASGSKILAGATVQNNTGQLYVVGNYNNAGTIGNFAFSTGTSGISISSNNLRVVVSVSIGSNLLRSCSVMSASSAAYSLIFSISTSRMVPCPLPFLPISSSIFTGA